MNTIIEIKNDTKIKTSNDMSSILVNTNNKKEYFIIGNVDSKTKGFERFADCYEKSIQENMIFNKNKRINHYNDIRRI